MYKVQFLPHPLDLRTHILPVFGDPRLDAITPNEVNAFARTLADDLSPVPVRSIVTVLGLLLREAINEHYLLFDPTARLRLRDGPSEPRPVATPADVWRLAGRMPNLHARLLVVTAAYTGMRFGELAGLSGNFDALEAPTARQPRSADNRGGSGNSRNRVNRGALPE